MSMKLSKFVVFGVAAAMSFGAFADAANKMIRFESANDVYADGSVVANGEWYALCWADNGFDGIKSDCTPVDTADKVLLVAPLAKDGGCPSVYFQVDSKGAPIGGQYYVYMLDTRINGVPASQNDAGKPAYVDSAKEASVYTITGMSRGETIEGTVDPAWAASFIDTSAEGFQTAKITNFAVTETGAEITVTGLMAGVKYSLLMGESLDKLDTYAAAQVKGGSDYITFKINNGAKFFKLVRVIK